MCYLSYAHVCTIFKHKCFHIGVVVGGGRMDTSSLFEQLKATVGWLFYWWSGTYLYLVGVFKLKAFCFVRFVFSEWRMVCDLLKIGVNRQPYVFFFKNDIFEDQDLKISRSFFRLYNKIFTPTIFEKCLVKMELQRTRTNLSIQKLNPAKTANGSTSLQARVIEHQVLSPSEFASIRNWWSFRNELWTLMK